jgi:FKBP-type peptidyl-prolyl cis-trans isomerase
MRKVKIMALIFTSVAFISSCGQAQKNKKNKEVKLETETQKLSYAIGKDVANNLKSAGVEIDVETFSRALEDVLTGKQLAMTEEEANKVIQDYQTKKMQEMQQASEAEAVKYRAEGEQFLTNNRSKEGVQQTASGLQYSVVKDGSGPKPTATSQVKVHYKGTLLDGTVFDSSYDRGEPATFGLNQVIRGWTEGLQLMSKGAKYMLYIPADLAYGNNPPPGSNIKAGMTLIFEVELLDILK